jgi:predicted XRE-type DNA-binding protein
MSSMLSKKSLVTRSKPPRTKATLSPNGSAKHAKTTTNSRTVEGEVFISGSGNVFADLGLPNPEERMLKAQLMHAIASEIERRHLTQEAASKLVDLKQADLSRIKTGRGSGFSSDRLIDVLRHLGHHVEIVVSRSDQPIGELRFRKLGEGESAASR